MIRVGRYDGRWDELAEAQSRTFLSDCAVADMAQEVDRLFKAFDSEAAQSLLLSNTSSNPTDRGQAGAEASASSSRPRCVVCNGENAKMRCSRCRSERYCGKECQVQHWPIHKKQCKL